MPTLQVFDPPMCCASGVCGPSVNPALPRLATDLQWLQGLGVQVERYGLAQQPAAFRDNAAVRETLAKEGVACLPLFRVGDVTVSKGVYPTRVQLAEWVGLAPPPAAQTTRCRCGGGQPDARC
ncbi:MAG: arsenite efflux transporter metallochaperone ArsD [Thermoguttaceae bacterium]